MPKTDVKKNDQSGDKVWVPEEFRSLADNAPDLIVRMDRRLRHLFVNQRILEVTGLTLADYLGRTNRELGMPEDLCDFWDNALHQVFETGQLQEIEFAYTGQQGERHFLGRLVPEKDRKGRIETILGIVRDITEQKQDQERLRRQTEELEAARASLEQSHRFLEARVAERASELLKTCRRLNEEISSHKGTARMLEESLILLESIFATTHFMLAYMDRDCNFVTVNKAYADAVGQTPAFFKGKNHFELYPHKENQAIFRRVVETGEPYFVSGKPFAYPDRPERGLTYWDWSLHPVKNDAGTVTGLVLGLVDVTENKRSEKALRQARKRYGETLKNSLDGFARVGMDNRFLEVNPAFEEIVGYSKEELRRITVQDITPEAYRDLEAGMMNTLLKEGHTTLYEKEYRRKDGSLIPVELRAYLSVDEEGGAREMWAFVRDITERKQQELKKKSYLQALEKSNKELEEFAYVASHDLQEPLRKIQMFGDRIRERYSDVLDEQGRDYLQRMINASTRMRNLIRALLEYSRISTRPTPFEPVDMNLALTEAMFNLEFRIQATGGTVESDRLPTVEADFNQMVQLMQNLVGNALKFHRPGVPPRVLVTARAIRATGSNRKHRNQQKGRYEIRVTDNGIGFNPRHLANIFKPFQRLHGRSRYDGVGMGLAICRKIVERHGGTLKAESEEGKGSTFVVTFSAKPVPAE